MQIVIVEKHQRQDLGIDQMLKIIQWQAVQIWDGKLPQVTGESIPFIQIGEKEIKK